MASFNKVILMGNLTRDPELRFTQSNMAICKVGLAVNRRFKDSQSGEWREEATFVDVTVFGKRGEAFEKFHKKGGTAFIEGSLRLDTWEDKATGGKRSKLYVVADNWEFVGSSREGAGSSRGGAGAGAGGGSYDEGSWGGSSGGSGAGGGYEESGGYSGGGSGGYGAPAQQGAGPEPDFLDAEDTPF